jgi:hypothetical protein
MGQLAAHHRHGVRVRRDVLPGARVTHSCDSLIKISRNPGERHQRILPDQAGCGVGPGPAFGPPYVVKDDALAAGKATGRLPETQAYVVRYQAGTTPATRSSSATRAMPCTYCPPACCRRRWCR